MAHATGIVEQRPHDDAIVVRWLGRLICIPADGVSRAKPAAPMASKGVYRFRIAAFYSRNIPNLFFAGPDHQCVARRVWIKLGSWRLAATIGAAVGMASTECRRQAVLPRALGTGDYIAGLQRALLRVGHHLPGLALRDPQDLVPRAKLTASSELQLVGLKPDGPVLPLAERWAMLLPVTTGTQLELTVFTHTKLPSKLRVELRVSSRLDNHTPDITLETLDVNVRPGTINRWRWISRIALRRRGTRSCVSSATNPSACG